MRSRSSSGAGPRCCSCSCRGIRSGSKASRDSAAGAASRSRCAAARRASCRPARRSSSATRWASCNGLYAAADVAFIGGSLVPHGGQNLLEACAVRVPVVFGPHMFHFEEISAMALERGAARQVHDVAGPRRRRRAVLRAARAAARRRPRRAHARDGQPRRARPYAGARRGNVASRRLDGERDGRGGGRRGARGATARLAAAPWRAFEGARRACRPNLLSCCRRLIAGVPFSVR